MKKKLGFKCNDVPTAKQDKCGNLVTNKSGLLKLYQDTYIERLTPKRPLDEQKEGLSLKVNLYNKRKSISSKCTFRPWETEQLLKICKTLKNSKARDESGFIYELFKPQNAGTDIFCSLTKLFNQIKYDLQIPEFLQQMTITSFYKNRGIKSDLGNERGIFNLSKTNLFIKINMRKLISFSVAQM